MVFTFKTTAEEAATELKDYIVGKNVVITGVSPKSLGSENARVVAPYAKTIIVASRSVERAGEVVKSILKETPKANLKVVALDLTSLASVRAAAAEILAFDIPIDVIVNNAAVPQCLEIVRTKEGFESQFGANHLGHFLFTSLLMPAVLRAATPASPARIVNVASVAASWGGEIRWDDPNFELRPQEFERYSSYAQTKMAGIMFAVGLARKFGDKNVLAYSLNPGAVRGTNMGGAVPMQDLVDIGVANPDGTGHTEHFFKSNEAGTSTQVIASFDPSIANQNGAFLDDGVVHNDVAAPSGLKPENADRLWELSEKLLGEKFYQA